MLLLQNAVLKAAEQTDPEILQVVLLGMGTVFAGIAAIILICKMLSILSPKEKPATKKPPETEDERISDELAAVIGAAVAEELGTDVSAIRIVSVKKVKR